MLKPNVTFSRYERRIVIQLNNQKLIGSTQFRMEKRGKFMKKVYQLLSLALAVGMRIACATPAFAREIKPVILSNIGDTCTIGGYTFELVESKDSGPILPLRADGNYIIRNFMFNSSINTSFRWNRGYDHLDVICDCTPSPSDVFVTAEVDSREVVASIYAHQAATLNITSMNHATTTVRISIEPRGSNSDAIRGYLSAYEYN